MVEMIIIFIVFMFAFTSFAPLIVEGKEPGMFIVHPKR
jgi:hypothetical protein